MSIEVDSYISEELIFEGSLDGAKRMIKHLSVQLNATDLKRPCKDIYDNLELYSTMRWEFFHLFVYEDLEDDQESFEIMQKIFRSALDLIDFDISGFDTWHVLKSFNENKLFKIKSDDCRIEKTLFFDNLLNLLQLSSDKDRIELLERLHLVLKKGHNDFDFYQLIHMLIIFVGKYYIYYKSCFISENLKVTKSYAIRLLDIKNYFHKLVLIESEAITFLQYDLLKFEFDKKAERIGNVKNSYKAKKQNTQNEICRIWSSGVYKSREAMKRDLLESGKLIKFYNSNPQSIRVNSDRALSNYTKHCNKLCRTGCINK